MASETLFTSGQKAKTFCGENRGHNEIQQGKSQSTLSCSCEGHDKSTSKSINGSTSSRECSHNENHLGNHSGASLNAKFSQLDGCSGSVVDRSLSEVRTVTNAYEKACLHEEHEGCDACSAQVQKHTKQQRNSTLQDLYFQADYDDDEDDDSDWEPVSPFVIKKWFCTNCTMPNFDDVCHCEVCGEDRECQFLRLDPIKSNIGQESQMAIESDAVHSYQDSYPTTRTAIGFDERMLLHAEVEMKSHPHPERPDRLRSIASSLAAAGIYPGKCFAIPAREITQEELLRVHSLEHIESVYHTRLMLASYFTSDTYANEHSSCAARLAAGLCADLARSIFSGSSKNGFALVRPPGHHAGVRQAMGFCLHNNAAVAAIAAQNAGAKKVLIVDWDVHHGNGTQEIFDGNKSVLYISLHRHENGRFYPGTGAVDEVGTMDAEGFSVNIPWSCGGVGDNDYIYAFQHVVLPIALEFAPDITIVSAGFDAARGDPLGCCDVTPVGYAQMTQMLTGLSQGKLLVILEGGYNLRSISSSATAVVKVLLGENPSCEMSNVMPSKAAVQTILQVLKVQMKYWPILKPSYMVLQSQWGLVASDNSCIF
ncbi:histone deacetylase 15 isoform X3 [Canna indica]|uniref:histone deacetylase n=1 Tax=Canna indica TaxID=4628 RepID=A0AAQ3QP67_9LILI|nr:histone deacetylase 15 isoform X3 [Canna indica]